MNIIETIFTLALIFLEFTFLYFFAKKTYLEINLKSGSIWPFILYRDFLAILLPLFLVQAYGVERFWIAIRHLENKDAFPISLFVLATVFMFVVTFTTVAKLFPIPHDITAKIKSTESNLLEVFSTAALLSGLILLIFAMNFLGYKHAFLSSILSGDNLIQSRLGNVYASKLPTQFSYLIRLAAQISSIYTPILLINKKITKSILFFMGALFLSSAAGDKAPVLMSVFLAVISYLSIKGSRISLGKIAFSIFIYFPVVYFLVFLVVSTQVPDLSLSEFNEYLINRVGVGQMSGVFETFSIPRIEGDFFWHAIPFANLFIDYPIYDKLLMMTVEGYEFDAIGVKNSFFISEAYGIGGWPLAIASPFIVGLSYALSFRILYSFLLKFFGKPIAIIYTMPIVFLSSNLTGGFSSFPLFKGLILNIITLSMIWPTFALLKRAKLYPLKQVKHP